MGLDITNIMLFFFKPDADNSATYEYWSTKQGEIICSPQEFVHSWLEFRSRNIFITEEEYYITEITGARYK